MRSLVRLPSLQARLTRRFLVASAEALLEGSYLEHLVDPRRIVPAWTILNAAAHGSPAWVRIVAARGREAGGTHLADPMDAASAICAELLAVAGEDDAILASTQANVLVPLELHLMASSAPAVGLTDVVASTRSLLATRRL